MQTIKLTPQSPDLIGGYTDSRLVVLCDCTDADILTTVPDAAAARDLELTYKQIDAVNTLTIAVANGQTIDGDVSMEVSGNVTIISDGSNWWSV
jgi:hypothetical protein